MAILVQSTSKHVHSIAAINNNSSILENKQAAPPLGTQMFLKDPHVSFMSIDLQSTASLNICGDKING